MNEVEITSEHTCGRAMQVLEELEDLRLEMGRVRDARVPMQVRYVSPREVYYHAQTAHRKANQLCVELGLESVNPPQAEDFTLARPADVMRVLDGVRERIADARASLYIEDKSPRPVLPGPLKREVGKEAADTMACCLIASRQLNVMLARPFGSQEGQERLLRSLVISEALLKHLGSKLPKPPPFERRKFARDVFQVLWQTCEALYQLIRESGVTVLEITRGFVGEDPTDVYDLASLIMSELEYVSAMVGLPPAPRLSGSTMATVLPSHNHRRARQLQCAINELTSAARAKPGWLRPH